jgi:hypothetical protein
MRRLLFILLIALLPLHGWAGDAMATQMAAGQLQHPALASQHATETIATSPHDMGATGHFDYENSMQDVALALHDCADAAPEDETHESHGPCETCSACQVCHSVALSPTAPELKPVFSARAHHHAVADSFASAVAALRHKPPIS